MKEIDFLPKWYKTGRRREVNYLAQYIALGVVVMIMVIWNFVMMAAISRSKSEFASLSPAVAQAAETSKRFDEIKQQISQLKKKSDMLDKIDSRIDIASVLGELSFLIDKKIVLSDIDFQAEAFTDEALSAKLAGAGVLRSAKTKMPNTSNTNGLLPENVRFKVTVNGVAADAGDVAKLICKLEDSPYFFQVIPSYSRNKEIKTTIDKKDKMHQVSEFEIVCYLANYENHMSFVKE